MPTKKDEQNLGEHLNLNKIDKKNCDLYIWLETYNKNNYTKNYLFSPGQDIKRYLWCVTR